MAEGRARRLKVPAYAKALLDNRRRGFHPLMGVDLWYGDDWSAARDQARREAECFVRFGASAVPYAEGWGRPVIAIRPRDFAPGVFDFGALAGVPVTVFDGCDASADFDQPGGDDEPVTRWGLFYDLLSEVAQLAASVTVNKSVFPDGSDLFVLAMDHRIWTGGGYVWPRWWSDDLNVKAGQCRAGWSSDMARVLKPGAALGAR